MKLIFSFWFTCSCIYMVNRYVLSVISLSLNQNINEVTNGWVWVHVRWLLVNNLYFFSDKFSISMRNIFIMNLNSYEHDQFYYWSCSLPYQI